MTHNTSFASKLATLAPGEWLALPDNWPDASPSRLERAVSTANARQPAKIAGMRFGSSRAVLALSQDPLNPSPVLIITRVE